MPNTTSTTSIGRDLSIKWVDLRLPYVHEKGHEIRCILNTFILSGEDFILYLSISFLPKGMFIQ